MLLLLLLAQTLITFVPMYATPAAWQLPAMLGPIAGARVLEPPMAWLGDYIRPGDLDKINGWLEKPPASSAQAFVISLDMLAYGGLDPSRIPGGVTETQAIERLRVLERLRSRHPRAWIAAFGTVMRLEPTSVEPVGEATNYSPIAQPPTWEYIWDYAQLHDPPLPSEEARAGHLRQLVGPETLNAYLQTRLRDRDVDVYALQFGANRTVDRIVLGADDAGPVGLSNTDVRVLQSEVERLGIAERASVEPGADELGSVLVAHALARSARWIPRIAVRYSTADGAETQDPLEFAPIRVTIANLIRLAGGVQHDKHRDITLYVRVPQTTESQDARLLREMWTEVHAGRSVAFVDLTFLTRQYDAQRRFVEELLASGVAPLLDAYSSWNTDANSVGIALSEAIAVGVGRRTAKYDPVAHAEFTANRYIENYLYHDIVRPQINAELDARGIRHHWYLAPADAASANQRVRELIYPPARQLLRDLYPHYRVEQLDIFLPWPRTDELESDIRFIRNR